MSSPTENITLLGLGSIGISFLALYLNHTSSTIRVYDPRPDLEAHIKSILPGYLTTPQTPDPPSITSLLASSRLKICTSLEEACTDATIIQESGPENLTFKSNLWTQVLQFASSTAHLWSSTSGITASRQLSSLPAHLIPSAQERLLVVHPFNPPHVMPLLELVPSPSTSSAHTTFAKSFFSSLSSQHVPVVIHKEIPGFVGNRLAFVLLREAMHLVAEGVVSADDLDTVVENSLRPRWAVTGPLKSYNYGGGAKGLDGFMRNLGETVEEVWEGSGRRSLQGTRYLGSESGADERGDWARDVVRKVEGVYGLPTPEQFARRDESLGRVLAAKRA